MMLFMQPEILIFKVLHTSGLIKEIKYAFCQHPKIKWLDEGLEPLISGLPVHCFTN